MSDQILDEKIKAYVSQRTIEIPEGIQQRFAGNVLIQLDARMREQRLWIGFCVLVVAGILILGAFYGFKTFRTSQNPPLMSQKMAENEAISPTDVHEKSENVGLSLQKKAETLEKTAPEVSAAAELLKNLSEDELLDLLVELEGPQILLEIDPTFFGDEMEAVESIEVMSLA